MSDFKHRNVKELKSFIKKYNDHFRIMLTGKKKADLVKAINEGMKKTVDDKLKKDYDMLSLKPIKSKPLEKPVDKPKSEPPARKTRVVKSEPVRSTPPPKPQRKIPKNRRGGIPDIDKEISSLLKTSKKIETKEAKKEFKFIKKPDDIYDDETENINIVLNYVVGDDGRKKELLEAVKKNENFFF